MPHIAAGFGQVCKARQRLSHRVSGTQGTARGFKHEVGDTRESTRRRYYWSAVTQSGFIFYTSVVWPRSPEPIVCQPTSACFPSPPDYPTQSARHSAALLPSHAQVAMGYRPRIQVNTLTGVGPGEGATRSHATPPSPLKKGHSLRGNVHQTTGGEKKPPPSILNSSI